jgi:hypothetical protein
VTVKFFVLVKLPPAAVTMTGPVFDRAGTVAVILVLETIVNTEEKPTKYTAVTPCRCFPVISRIRRVTQALWVDFSRAADRTYHTVAANVAPNRPTVNRRGPGPRRPAAGRRGQLWSSDSKTVSSTDTPGRSMRSYPSSSITGGTG